MQLRPSARFGKSFKALSSELQARARKSLKQFRANPRHPSLHFEKIATGYRTIRVDKNFRIVLRSVDETEGVFDIVDIDSHDKVYAKYG